MTSTFERGKTIEVGSEEWFSKVFSVWSESEGMKRVKEVLANQGRESELRGIVEEWVGTQVFFFLTEFGAGKRLALQPPYRATLEQGGDGLRVFAFNLQDYGDQKKSYVNFEGIDEKVRLGLAKVYGKLAEIDKGEVLVRVSPTEFYEDFGSSYDVLEIYRVVDYDGDGNKVIEGRYVVLDRVLKPEERMYIQSMFSDLPTEYWVVGSAGERLEYSAESFVMNPMHLKNINMDGLDSSALAYEIDSRFVDKYGRALIEETDFEMYDLIRNRVGENIEELVDLLLGGRSDVFVRKLSEMMFDSQHQWAVRQGVDPFEHVDKILRNEFTIGFEVGFGGEVWNFDPVANQWVSYGFETIRFCASHEETYTELNCPKCRKEKPWLYSRAA